MKDSFIMLFSNCIFFVLLSGCKACFTYNQIMHTKIKTGSSWYQECHCDQPDGSGIHLKWLDTREEEIVPLGPGTKSNIYSEWMDRDTYGVYISNITKSISGAYKCETNYKDQRYTLTYHVEAYDPPYFINTERDQSVVYGRDALVTCEAGGDSVPMMAWYKEQDGLVEITNDDKYEVTANGLLIKHVTDHDSGVYKCTASDLETGEGIDRDIAVHVISTPTITEVIAKPDSKILIGDSLTIECLASGFPHPEYSWRKISDTGIAEANVTWLQEANKMEIKRLTAADQGTYECSAVNSAGNDSMIIPIQVLMPPNITQFENVSAVEGSTIQIICKASGRPIPKIHLTFLGEESEDQSIVWDSKNVSDTHAEFYLTLLAVNRTHGGVYVCNASNDVDFAIEEMSLTVFHAPIFFEPLENAWGWSGKVTNLSCESLSNPPAEVTWRYHVNEIPKENQVDVNRMMSERQHDTWLVMDNLTLYGVYECVAANEYGEARKIINLQEGYVPPAITNISIDEVTSSSAMFWVEEPEMYNGPRPIGVRSEYDELRTYNVTNIHTNRTWATGRRYRLDRLRHNTTYLIKFAAINDVGAGPWSDYVQFITLEKNPGQSPPEDPIWMVTEQDVAADLVLKWKSSENEQIDCYIIKQCPVYNGSTYEDECEESIAPAAVRERRVGGVSGTYYLELVAHNAHGNSSALHMFITLSDEEEPILSTGAVIGVSIVAVFVGLVLLDLLLLTWRRQGVVANCYNKKSKNKLNISSRDKKGLLKENDGARPNVDGHRAYEYNKNTGVITGKHSAV